MKVHLAVSSRGITPGSVVTGHLCGREHSGNDTEGNNSTEDRAEVTCALCAAIIADPNHWRHRKHLASKGR